MKIRYPMVLCATMLLCSWSSGHAGDSLPLFDGLGEYKRQVTTKSEKAQQYFNQGMRLLFGFNHGTAIKSFQEAARLDPEFAMAHWGIALASGPHINLPLVPPAAAELAWKELQLAKATAGNATPVEQALIEALSHRYANPQPADRSPLDRAYADAMRKVWQAYPQDADVGVLFAEAMMDLRPWDQWTVEGEAQPGTDEIIATLDAVLRLNINHPFANHLYIHAYEASHAPERALAAADRLLKLQPNLAHNVHMPSHIYIRLGRWQQAIDSNVDAVKANAKYRETFGPARGFLPVYVAHDSHMLTFAAMMTGQSELALRHIQEMVTQLPDDFVREYAMGVEGFAAMPLEVLLRFGRWDDVLAQPDDYADYMPFTRAFRHAARAIAWAAKGDTAQARDEQAKYLAAAERVSAEATFGNNPVSAILQVVTPMVEGEILVREDRLEEGIKHLRTAIAAEDKLRYDEPPGWLIPVRHALGATLMQNRRYAEAEQVYREDLKRLPNNGWSLFGLSEALALQGKSTEALTYREQFQLVWKDADLELTSSCFCQPGPAKVAMARAN